MADPKTPNSPVPVAVQKAMEAGVRQRYAVSEVGLKGGKK